MSDFLVNNYKVFLVIAVILIFALIGYLIDTSNGKKNIVLPKMKKDPKEVTPKKTEIRPINNNMTIKEAIEKNQAKEAKTTTQEKPLIVDEPNAE